MQGDLRLSPTSYIVLGLLELTGEATPYDLKQRMEDGVANFWSLQHSALYSEPARLAAAGLLTEEREAGGRRRRRYRITAAGRRALGAWTAEPTGAPPELRDPGLLKLFFGAEPEPLAAVQLDAHRAKLAGYEALRELDSGEGPRGPWLALDAGIAHEREWVRYWRALAGGS